MSSSSSGKRKPASSGDVKKRRDAFGVGMPYPLVIPYSDVLRLAEGGRLVSEVQSQSKSSIELQSVPVRNPHFCICCHLSILFIVSASGDPIFRGEQRWTRGICQTRNVRFPRTARDSMWK